MDNPMPPEYATMGTPSTFRIPRPAAEPDVEERFVALQRTDERQQAEIAELRASLGDHLLGNNEWADGVEARLDTLEATGSASTPPWKDATVRAIGQAVTSIVFVGLGVWFKTGNMEDTLNAVVLAISAAFGWRAVGEGTYDQRRQDKPAEAAERKAKVRAELEAPTS